MKQHQYTLRKGLSFQALAERFEIPIEFDCRESDCGICIVRINKGLENLSEHTVSEKDFLQAMHADPDERLACQCRVFGDVELTVEY